MKFPIYLGLKITQYSLIIAGSFFLNVYGASEIRENNKAKPWMFFVDKLLPPSGPKFSEQFTVACSENLKSAFDSISYQVIQLSDNQTPEDLSNNKKDLILSSDSHDFWIRGDKVDTLVLWVRYRVGFNHSRVVIPYLRGTGNKMPALVAKAVLETVTAEFLSSITLQGGPPGISVSITEDITAYPPCYFYLPPGNYELKSSFPGFVAREDSLELFPGKSYNKRILLLPQ